MSPTLSANLHSLDSPFAPANGYRYDGLSFVDDHWHEQGRSGLLVWRFWLRSTDQTAPPTRSDRSPPVARQRVTPSACNPRLCPGKAGKDTSRLRLPSLWCSPGIVGCPLCRRCLHPPASRTSQRTRFGWERPLPLPQSPRTFRPGGFHDQR